MKKFIVAILTVCTLCTTVFASSLPNSVREYKENDNTYMVKTYEVAEGTENKFERELVTKYKDGFKIYELDNISKSGGTALISREETQIKVVETDSDKIEDVIPLFPSEIEYLEDDEYYGTLVLDTSSIVTTKISDGSYYKKYNITDRVEYRNYSKNDMDKIPKTRVKNGITMYLVSVDWKVQNTEMVGNSQVPVSYIAIANYKGTGTQKIEGEKKYTSSATYTGIIEKTEVNPYEYEVTYIKTADYTVLVIVSGVMCTIGVILIIVGLIQNISRKNKKKKTNINNTRRFY